MRVKNPIRRIIPSYIVPTEPIDLGGFILTYAGPVQVNDDWQRTHFSASIEVYEDDLIGRTDRWIAFHSLLASSRLPLYSFHAYGHGPSDFQVTPLDKKEHPDAEARTLPFHPDNCLPAVYFSHKSEELPSVSYKDLYERYSEQSDNYKVAIQNFFLAQDINFNSRLRGINKSFWTVVMLVSALEALLPPPEYCEGEKCTLCGRKNRHVLNNVDKDWNALLFDRIKNKTIKKQYRAILDTARWKIRNDTVHNGLAPPAHLPHAALPDGVTLYTTETIIQSYLQDSHSLEGFVDQLVDLCRYTLLNVLVKQDVYPELKAAEIHSITFKNITSSSAILNLNTGTVEDE